MISSREAEVGPKPGRRQRQKDSNHAFGQQLAVRITLGRKCADVLARTGRAIDQPENRIGAIALVETILNRSRADAPCAPWFMASSARPAVGSEALKERIGRGVGWRSKIEGLDRAGRIGVWQRLGNYGRKDPGRIAGGAGVMDLQGEPMDLGRPMRNSCRLRLRSRASADCYKAQDRAVADELAQTHNPPPAELICD